ncbi:phostensin-like [Salmo salar]|uniref:Phostensin-like n=1 Tax=Salmo salar TaxID=8030 RepID=A0A1S3M2N4_SALSA|nr:phostensin-like [Salmo salar]
MYEEAGFTRAAVKNTEASFARRVPIKHDGRERAVEREVKQMTEERERGMERARSTEREVVVGRQAEPLVRDRRGSDFRRGSDARDVKRMSEVRDCIMSVETTQQNCVITLSVDRASPPQSVESHYRHVSAFTECSPTLLSAVAHRGTDWHSSQGVPGHHSTQSALSQHTGDLINKIGRVGETANELDNYKRTQTLTQDSKCVMREDTKNVRGSKAYRVPSEVSKESAHSPGTHVHSHVYPEMSVQEVTPKSPKSPKHVSSVGIPPTPLEMHIPRTVFYGVGEALENKRPSLQSEDDQSCEGEGGKGVERRDSWRIGKPLSRIESLREKIRQREKERLRNMDGAEATGDDGDATEGMKKAGARRVRRASSSDRCDEGERGNEMGRERQRQEGSASQTTSTQFYVTQEVSVLKADPELPVPLSFSQSVKGEEETDHTIEREEDPIKHVVDELRCDKGRQRKQDSRGRGGEVGEDKLSEEEDRLHYLSPSRSPSPSDSFSPSLAEMSRIYSLKTVGPRTAVCMSERTVDRPIPSHTPKVQSQISAEQQEPSSLERSVGRLAQGGGGASGNKASCEENSGLQIIQRQVEQLQLREQQEVQRQSHDDNAAQSTFSKNTNLKAKESEAQQSTRISHNQPNKEPQQMHPRQKDQQTPLNPRKSRSNPQLHSERPPQPNQPRSITINSRSLLTPSTENSLHPDQGVPPTTSSSPCSPSPPQSPSVSPSPSPSPTHFTIRTVSGGQQVKRGTTITITPRKPVGGAAVESVSVSSGPPVKTSTKAQMPVLTEVVERGKKRYPTTEEIEVIGGYQNLEKSCLVKTPKGTPKGVKVCFDETQLEQVFEYPSEASMIAFTPYPIPGQEKGKEDEVQEEEEEEERGVFVSGSSRNVGAAAGLRVLRIDESCHR